MSDTPETDAMEYFDAICDPDRVVEADFCRKLERERDKMSDAFIMTVDEMVQVQSQLRDVERERDTYREQADALVDRLGATQERMIDAERERDKLAEALSLAGKLCNVVHHPKSMQHETFDPCPVEALIKQALYKTQ